MSVLALLLVLGCTWWMLGVEREDHSLGAVGLEDETASRSAESPGEVVPGGREVGEIGAHVKDMERVPVDAVGGLSGRVLTMGGDPVVGAEVSWTPLAMAGEPGTWQRVDALGIFHASQAVSSEANGTFVLPPSCRSESGVVWVTAHDLTSEWQVVRNLTGEGDSLIFEMGPGIEQAVVVSRESGQSVDGAQVNQRAALGWVYPAMELSDEELSRRLFARTALVGEGGELAMPCGVGEFVYSARLGELRSSEVVSSSGEKVTLELAETISASGTIRMAGPGGALNGSLSVLLEDPASGGKEVIRTRSIPADGVVREERWPWRQGARYHVIAEGPVLGRAETWVNAPSEGGRLVFELVFDEVVSVRMRFVAASEESGLGGEEIPRPVAGVSVRPRAISDAGEALPTPFGSFVSGEGGLVTITNCPIGPAFFPYSAEGFMDDVVTTRIISEPITDPIEVWLIPASQLRVLVTDAGRVVPDFKLYFWPEGTDHSNCWIEELHAEGEGGALLSAAPVGGLSLFVKAPGRAQSATQTIKVDAGGMNLVEIALPETVAGVGHVFDGVTRQPVQGAVIAATVNEAGDSMGRSGDSTIVGSDGSFRLEAFPPRISTIRVDAAGYSPLAVIGDPGSDGEIDFGTLYLNPVQTLTIRCRSSAQIAWGECYGRVTGGSYQPPAALGEDGVFVCEQGQHGQSSFELTLPDGTVMTWSWTLFGAGPWTQEVDLGLGLALDVRLKGEGSMRPAFLMLEQNSERDTTDRTMLGLLDGERSVTLRAVGPGPHVLSCLDKDWNRLAAKVVQVIAGASNEVELELGGLPFTVHVTSEDQLPIEGAIVEARDVRYSTDVLSLGFTDADGLVTLSPMEGEQFLLDMIHPAGGYLPPTAFKRPGKSRVIELVWNEPAPLELLVTDDGVPLDGLELWIHERLGGYPCVTMNTPSDGHYTREGINPGEYFVEPHSAWVWFERRALVVEAAGGLKSLSFRRLGDLSLTFTDLLGNPMAGVAVELTSTDLNESAADWLAEGRVESAHGLTTSEAGEVRITGLPHGTYAWVTSAGSGTLMVPAEGEAHEEFALDWE